MIKRLPMTDAQEVVGSPSQPHKQVISKAPAEKSPSKKLEVSQAKGAGMKQLMQSAAKMEAARRKGYKK